MLGTSDFNCAICLDTASEPVVTRCGHLFCWGCLDHWLRSRHGGPVCPVCKGRVSEALPGDIIPLYGKGKKPEKDPRPEPVPASTAEAGTAAEDGAAPATAHATTARDTSYHFNYVRARNVNREEHEESGGGGSGSASHPRPAAQRAPTPPPNERNEARHAVNGRWRASPLSIGGSVFFLGNVSLTILFVLCVAFYALVPWRTLVESLKERAQRARAQGWRAFFDTPPNATNPTNPTNATTDAAADTTDSNSTATAAANRQPPPLPVETITLFVVLGTLTFFVVTSLVVLL